MKKTILLVFLFLSFFVRAQDDLFSLIENDNSPVYISYLFKGTKVVNSPSVELTSNGVLQFTIQHRFGPLNSGFYNLYGLDNSQVRLGFDYGFMDWLDVGIGRSSSTKTLDANLKFRIKRQVSKGFPFVIVLNSAFFLKQWQYSDTKLESFLLTDQFCFSNQLLIARKINRNFTIQLTPTMVHYNLVYNSDEAHDRYSLGFGGRQKLTKRVTVNAEYFYQLNEKNNFNVLSFGFDIETGGHIFQLHLSNSSSMIVPDFVTKTKGDWLKGDIYFGFNISRVFTLKKM